MTEKIVELLLEVKNNYYYYLGISESKNFHSDLSVIEARIHDLKIEIDAYENVLDILKENKE